MAADATLIPGTLDLLILKAVSLGQLHGYAVLLRIEQITKGALVIKQGALYPALAYRWEERAPSICQLRATRVDPIVTLRQT